MGSSDAFEIRRPGLRQRVELGEHAASVRSALDDWRGGGGPLDRIEEADEFLMAVLVHAAAEHGAFGDVEGGKQRGPGLRSQPCRDYEPHTNAVW